MENIFINRLIEGYNMGSILIVEDNELTRRGFVDIAKKINPDINIFETNSSKEGYKIAKNNNIDAFFLDLDVLDYSGIELSKQIREIEKYKLIPIVFITANVSEEIYAFRNIHCYSYITKPFSKEDIKETFKTIISFGIPNDKPLKSLIIEGKHCKHQIYIDEIIFIESVQRKIRINTIYEQILTSSYSLNEVLEILGKSFIQCHRGFIVNKKQIKTVNYRENNIILHECRENIPIGRKYKNDLKESL